MSELLTIDDLAKYLKLSKRSCYELTKARTRARQKHPVPLIRINGHARFVKADVENWIQKLREEQAA
jgi:predicted DNA-binding transcriptional regulator AlpA